MSLSLAELHVGGTRPYPPPEAMPAVTFALIRRWQEFLMVSGETNENTARQYRRLLLEFIAETLRPLEDVSEDDVVAYLAAIDPHGMKRGMALRALKSFYRWAQPRGIVPSNPVVAMKVRRPKLTTAPSLTPEQLDAVLVAAEKVDPRARWTLQLAYATGARLGSLVEVTEDDIRWEPEPWLEFRVAKGDAPYGVPLGPKAIEAVRHLVELRDYTPRTVKTRRSTLVGVGPGTVWKWAHRAGELAGIKVWPHLLRHTFGTRLMDTGHIVDVRTWVELMGHADASQLRRYAAPSDPNLRAAVEAL